MLYYVRTIVLIGCFLFHKGVLQTFAQISQYETFSSADFNGEVTSTAVYGDVIYVAGHFTKVNSIRAERIIKWDGSSWVTLGSGFNSLNDTIKTMTLEPSTGHLYVGGSFNNAGGNLDANNIAKWDGSNWIALGDSIAGTVRSIILSNSGDLYVGGRFSTIGNLIVNNIAKWDGTSWSALGTGLQNKFNFEDDAFVNSIDARGDSIIVAGRFNKVGVNVDDFQNLALFYQNVWHTVGIEALHDYYQNKVNGIVQYVRFSPNGSIYVAGDIIVRQKEVPENSISDETYSWISWWNGNRWNGVDFSSIERYTNAEAQNDFSLNGFAPPIINDLIIDDNNNLYVGGWFKSASGVPNTANLAKWNGTIWESIGTGVDNGVRNTRVNTLNFDSSNNILLGGKFTISNGVTTDYFAKWDVNELSDFATYQNDNEIRGLQFQTEVKTIYHLKNGDILIGGNFNSIGSLSVNGLARWDGNNWHDFGGTTDFNSSATILSIIEFNGEIYAGGNFSNVDDNSGLNYIVKWNGSSWQAVGSGLNDIVTSMTIFNNNLYVGGHFTEAGGNAQVHAIARWDGSTWHKLGNGLPEIISNSIFGTTTLYPNVKSIDSNSSNLVIGGFFIDAGGEQAVSYNDFFNGGYSTAANYVASWDGTSWHPIGEGLVGAFNGLDVNAITFDDRNGDVYVGGRFSSAGAVSVNNIAKWDGTNWSALGNGTDGDVFAIGFNNGKIYVGGNFQNAGAMSINSIAEWDGTNWNRVAGIGTAANENVNDILFANNNMYLAGTFTVIDYVYSPYFTYQKNVPTTQSVQVIITGSAGWRLLANPIIDATFSTVLSPLWTQGAVGGDATGGSANVFTWSTEASNNDVSSWLPITTYNAEFPPGKGILMQVYSDDNGPNETGDSGFPKIVTVQGSKITVDVDLTENINPNVGGWTLLGNPYPSAINWNLVSKTGLSNSVYVWDHNGSEWKYYSSGVGTLTDGIIGEMNAFFVETMSSEPTLTIPLVAQEMGVSAFLGKREGNISPLVFSLKLENGREKSSVFIHLHKDARLDRDGLDAVWLQPLKPSYIEFAALTDAGEQLAIFSAPTNAEYLEIPMLVNVSGERTARLSLDTLSVESGYNVRIWDSIEGLFYLPGETISVKPFLGKNHFPLTQLIEHVNRDSREENDKNEVPTRLSHTSTESNINQRYILQISRESFLDVASELPNEITLLQNFPNPFNPSTTFRFGLVQTSDVSITVMDVLGRVVAQPIRGNKTAGWHNYSWDASRLASGIYFYHLSVNGKLTKTMKMTLIK